MRKTLDLILLVLALGSLLIYAGAAINQNALGNTETAFAYCCAAAWVVIYLVM